MYFTDDVFSGPTWWIGHVLYWPVLLHAIRHAQWWRLRNSADLNVLFGMTMAVAVLWVFRAGFYQGLSLHLLGATLLTLMFSWAFALMSMSVVILITSLFMQDGMLAFGMNALLFGAFPVGFSFLIYRNVDRYLPNHFFIYIFLNAFFGAALTIAVVGLASAGVLYLADVYTMEHLSYNFLRYLPLLMFPEAFITGMLMTLFVLYYPQWVTTFDDLRYLKNH